ncbi:MAG TPA: Cof-type HAD-IIB family hydrolase [Candidatus Tetragenococcus pullicola]|nr:Cof-type HAD-IIB family hydrolase [Candidatus Tetragenococcus pullicola]
MIKAIFFDIDGTLLTSRGKISKTTKKAIFQAQQNGVLCGVSTGRSPMSVKRILKDLPLDMFVTYNGQYVYTTKEIVRQEPFDQKVLAEVVAFSDRKSRQIAFFAKNHLEGSLTVRISETGVLRHLIRFVPKRFPIRRMKLILQKYSPRRRSNRYKKLSILKEPIYQCVLLSAEYEANKLRRLLPNCDFQRSNPYSVDIVPKGGSKFVGIESFLNDRGIKKEETMVFGDHFNDIEMIQGVGIGIAMGNAMKETKEAADYVTLSNDDEGIIKALQHFKIID